MPRSLVSSNGIRSPPLSFPGTALFRSRSFPAKPGNGDFIPAQQAGGLEQHHYDQNNGIDQHPVSVEVASASRVEWSAPWRNNGAGDGTHTAQHHHDQEFHRPVGNRIWTDRPCRPDGQQAAGNAGEEGGQYKGHQFVVGGIDARKIQRRSHPPGWRSRPARGRERPKVNLKKHRQDHQHAGIDEQRQLIGEGTYRTGPGRRQ